MCNILQSLNLFLGDLLFQFVTYEIEDYLYTIYLPSNFTVVVTRAKGYYVRDGDRKWY